MNVAPYRIKGTMVGRRLSVLLQQIRVSKKLCEGRDCRDHLSHLVPEMNVIVCEQEWTPQEIHGALGILDAMERHELATPEVRELFPDLREVLWHRLLF